MILASLSEILCWLGEAVTWTASNFGAPILTGAVAGLAVPLAFRWESTPGEVRQHNREVADLNADFRRFMSDLSRQVEHEHQACVAEMSVEIAKREMEDQRRDAEGLPPQNPDLATELRRLGQRIGWTKRTTAAMFDALWRYRDEALRKRGKFIQIVEAESPRHEWYRRRKGCGHPALRLSEDARTVLDSWRKRPNPFEGSPEDLLVIRDLTAMELTLLPLELESGLTWAAAKRSILAAEDRDQPVDRPQETKAA
jgi:hypothetical protein